MVTKFKFEPVYVDRGGSLEYDFWLSESGTLRGDSRFAGPDRGWCRRWALGVAQALDCGVVWILALHANMQVRALRSADAPSLGIEIVADFLPLVCDPGPPPDISSLACVWWLALATPRGTLG